MNGLEKRYAEELDARRICGQILGYWFEAFTFKLAKGTRYTPDFVLMLPDGTLEAHEVKGGHWEDDARVKIKVAAELFPLRFVAVQAIPKREGGGWKLEEF